MPTEYKNFPSGVWISDDGGVTWSPVPPAPAQGTSGTGGGTPGPTGPTGATGATGPPGSSTGSFWYTGTTAPSNVLGIDGDYYLRSNGDYYGPKVGGVWGSVVGNLVGPAGTAGAAGATGATGATGPQGPAATTSWHTGSTVPSNAIGVNGDFYLRSNGDYYGPKAGGAWAGPAGSLAGPSGAAGAAGTPGAAGAAGALWFTGAGAPSNASGANGDFYLRSNGDYYGPKAGGVWGAIVGNLKGATGATGPAGPAGPAGATGATGPPGPSGNADVASLEARVTWLEGLGRFNVLQGAGIQTNGADCSAGIQNLINFFGGSNVPLVLFFPRGDYNINTQINQPYSNLVFEGLGNRVSRLVWKGTSPGAKMLNWGGSDAGLNGLGHAPWTDRVFNGGLKDIGLIRDNTANPDMVLMYCHDASGMFWDHVAWWGARSSTQGGALTLRSVADWHMMEPEADFCGSHDGSFPGGPAFDFGGVTNGEWSVDRGRIWGGRIENCGDMPFKFKGIPAHSVAKCMMINTKIENSLTDDNGQAGSTTQGAAVWVENTIDFRGLALQNTIQGLRSSGPNPAAGPTYTLYHFKNCNGVHLQTEFSWGSIGVIKPFSYLITTDGGQAFHYDIMLSNSNNNPAVLPNNVFRWLNSPQRVYRDGSMWDFDSSNTYPTADSGTFNTSQTGMWNDSRAVAANALFLHAVDFDAHTINTQTLTAGGTATVRLTKADATSGAFSVVLPTASANLGRERMIIRTNSAGGNVTITGAINAQSLTSQYASAVFRSDGTNWYKVAGV